MSKILVGDVCADCGKPPGSDKRKYVRMGVAFRDSQTGAISLKIDALPLACENWVGWVNIFERRQGEKQTQDGWPPNDIPF